MRPPPPREARKNLRWLSANRSARTRPSGKCAATPLTRFARLPLTRAKGRLDGSSVHHCSSQVPRFSKSHHAGRDPAEPERPVRPRFPPRWAEPWHRLGFQIAARPGMKESHKQQNPGPGGWTGASGSFWYGHPREECPLPACWRESVVGSQSYGQGPKKVSCRPLAFHRQMPI